MQVRWGLRSPRTEHKHHDQRRTGSRAVCTKRTARYEPTRTALRGYNERKLVADTISTCRECNRMDRIKKGERKRERVVDGK